MISLMLEKFILKDFSLAKEGVVKFQRLVT
jgi:hypothetical protein